MFEFRSASPGDITISTPTLPPDKAHLHPSPRNQEGAEAPTTIPAKEVLSIVEKHQANVDFDVFLEHDEAGLWVAEVPSLPGVYTQANTRKEALERIREAIQLYLETEGVPPSRSVGVERVHVEA